jgi:hypothetical protein
VIVLSDEFFSGASECVSIEIVGKVNHIVVGSMIQKSSVRGEFGVLVDEYKDGRIDCCVYE